MPQNDNYEPDVGALLEELKKRKSEMEPRNAAYRRTRAAYFGDPDLEAGYGVEAMDSAGRVVLRADKIRNSLIHRNGKVNLLTPIVDDYMYLRGPVPTMKVLPEDESDPAKIEAIKRSRIVRAQWSNSRMDVQQIEAAWYLTDLGDCVYTLTPVFEEQEEVFYPSGVYITVVDPEHSYPRFRTGFRRGELSDLYICDLIDKEQARAEYNVERDKKEIEVVHYYSRDYNCLIVDEELIDTVVHNLGFCPAEWVRNKEVGGRFAQSDIGGVLDQHNELQIMTEVMKDSLIEVTYSGLVVKDPVNVNEQFEVGPGAAPIVVQGTGDVRRIPPAPPPQGADMIIGRQWENIQHQTGSAPVRTEGKIEGSNISARAINTAQGPMETRLAGTQLILGQALQRLNAKILLMFSKLDGFKGKTISIWGQEAGKPFTTSFTPDELNGWFRNSISYGAMVGSSNHEKAVVGLQLMGQQLVPGEWVLEQIGVDDPETQIKEAEAQAMARMKQQQAMQGGGQPGSSAQAGPAPGGDPGAQQAQVMAPAEQGQSLAAGGQGDGSGDDSGDNLTGSPSGGGDGQVQPAPPPPMPGFNPMQSAPTAPGIGSPTPTAGPLQQVRAAIAAAADKMQGKITEAKPEKDRDGIRIKVTITDWRDKSIVRAAFEAEGLKTHIITTDNAHKNGKVPV
jgi:hypothetical protein